jgi:hypothetical protein
MEDFGLNDYLIQGSDSHIADKLAQMADQLIASPSHWRGIRDSNYAVALEELINFNRLLLSRL